MHAHAIANCDSKTCARFCRPRSPLRGPKRMNSKSKIANPECWRTELDDAGSQSAVPTRSACFAFSASHSPATRCRAEVQRIGSNLGFAETRTTPLLHHFQRPQKMKSRILNHSRLSPLRHGAVFRMGAGFACFSETLPDLYRSSGGASSVEPCFPASPFLPRSTLNHQPSALNAYAGNAESIQNPTVSPPEYAGASHARLPETLPKLSHFFPSLEGQLRD